MSLLRNKYYYLYLTEFFAGMSMMAVELGASRLLAPYFSSSQIVWTIIIGTIMIAMALGNVFGGRWADRDANPALLYRRLIIAALWIACIPVLGKYFIVAITGLLIVAVDTNLLTWAAFFACLAIFVFPCFLLGTVTPSLVKYTVSSLDESGSTVGRLNACNTIGSILGTFLPTFVTIPAWGTAVTFWLFAGILLALGLTYFLAAGTGRKAAAAALLAFALLGWCGTRTGFAFWEDGLTYEGESIYNYLQVRDTEESTVFSTNVLFGVQSLRMKQGELTGMYYDYALAAPVLADVAAKTQPRILVLGMGTGTFADSCRRYFPQAEITGVEIDGKITELARQYFALDRSIPVATYDGRAYLAVDKGKYDVIMVDAYQDITIPFQMSSVEFFRLVREHLTEDGVLVVNMNMRDTSENSINLHLADTIASVFPQVATVDVQNGTNRELFAAMSDRPLRELPRRTQQLKSQPLRAHLSRVAAQMTTYKKGPRLLTDDRAPVELLSMQAIDGIIARELQYYRKVYQEKGVDGILQGM